MKIKTLLFGAGAGSKLFMENEINNRTFLAYIDNDIKKHNTFYEGMLIISPDDIEKYDFDEIVITTQWAKDVEKQLIEDVKINKAKIILPPKGLLRNLHPFKDNKTIKLARKIITKLSEEAFKEDIPLTIDFGTLLGVIRDGDIIPWDDDIDFTIPLESSLNIEGWLLKVVPMIDEKVHWTIDKHYDKEKVVSYSIKFIDRFLKSFTTTVCMRGVKDDHSIHFLSLGLWYAPALHFEKTELVKWNGVNVQTPNKYEEYLSFVYGDWKVPKQNMTIDDYNHTAFVPFEELKEEVFLITRILN